MRRVALFSSKKANKFMVVRPHGKAPVNPPAVLEIIFLYSLDIGPF